MNKDEIEDIKDNLRTLYKVLWNEHREGTYTIERILEYINCLEQKESILDKVTDKLKEDIKIYGNPEERKQMCKEQLYENDGKWFHAREILNIIEGERNNG